MNTALDDIAFLANSDNRVAVFERLVDGSRDRDELINQVDASRVTIARILRELEAREWVTCSGPEYTVTPLGEWVYDEFARLVDEMEAEHRVREAMQWLPSDRPRVVLLVGIDGQRSDAADDRTGHAGPAQFLVPDVAISWSWSRSSGDMVLLEGATE